MRFLVIDIKNFLSYDKVSFNLDKRGIVFVKGINNDSPKFDSNGSGKSALFEAIYFALYGNLLRKGKRGPVRKGEDKCIVKLRFKVNKDEFLIVREKGKIHKLKLYQNDEDISLPDIRKTQSLINDIIHPDVFVNTVLFSGSLTQSFLNGTDAQRKDIMMKMFGLDIFIKAQEKAKEKVKVFDRKLRELEVDLESSKKLKKELKSMIKDIEEKIKGLNEEVDIEKLEKERRSMKKKLYELNTELDSKKELFNEKIKEKNDLEKNLSDISFKIKTLKKEYGEKQKLVKSGKCPVCLREIKDEKDISYDFSSVEKEIEKLEKKQSKLSEQVDKKQKEVDKLVDEITSIESEVSELEDKLQTIKFELNEYKVSRDKYEDDLKEKNKRIKELSKEINLLEKNIEDISKEKEVYDFWKKGFGYDGIISFLMKMYLPEINNELNKYLSILIGGGVQGEFIPFTILKSGEVRDKWQFKLTGYEDYDSCSSGERRRIDVALLLSFNSILRRRYNVNMIVLDEVFDPLDRTGIDSIVVDILEELKKEISSIFVISHNPEFDLDCNYIEIIKEGGISKVVE